MRDRLNLAAALLEPSGTARGARVAVREPQRAWTYDELGDTVARLAAGLRAIGVRPGDRVAVLMPDGLEAACAILAIVHFGGIAVPLSELQRPNDVRAFVRDAGAVAAIVHESLQAVLGEVRAELPTLREVIVVGVPRAGELAFDALVSHHRPAPPADTDADDIALILYSTSPSERPRGVAHRHGTPLAAFRAYSEGIFAIREDDRVFCPSRLATAFGLGSGLVYPLAAGAQAILLPQQARSRAVLDVLEGLRPTLLVAAPSLFAQLLADLEGPGDERVQTSLRACIAGGEPVSPRVITRARERLGVEVLPGYGLTEAFHFVIATPAGGGRPGGAGKIIPGFEARIVSGDGAPVATHEIGTLEVRGPTLAVSYWNREDDSKVLFRDGWLRTADRFFVDDDGTFFHCGRSDDLFKVSGKWVSPGEVERTLLAHEAVWECAVIGVEDDDGLTKPLAYVVPNVGHGPGGAELERELIAHVKREIAPYKYPRWIEFVDAIPKNSLGKVQRYKLPKKRPGRAETAR